MIYYFVEDDGMVIETEDQHRGYFEKRGNPGMFTTRRAAVKGAMRELQHRIKEMQIQYAEYRAEISKSAGR